MNEGRFFSYLSIDFLGCLFYRHLLNILFVYLYKNNTVKRFFRFLYRPFHKTLPRSSAFVNWISVRFYETDCRWISLLYLSVYLSFLSIHLYSSIFLSILLNKLKYRCTIFQFQHIYLRVSINLSVYPSIYLFYILYI